MDQNATNKKILVVEDHDSIRMLLGSWLTKQDYTVTTKKDGYEGMVWLHKGNVPDLILLDMEMPRINGKNFLENIKNSGFYSDIPVMVLSGNDSEKDVNDCIKLGVTDYIQKPFNPISLNNKIFSIFNEVSKVA